VIILGEYSFVAFHLMVMANETIPNDATMNRENGAENQSRKPSQFVGLRTM